MKVSDLTGIGRLGGIDADGFYQVLVKPRHRRALADANEIFLIFNSDRVFFVTISDRDISDRKLRLKFAEEGIEEERKLHREVILALPAQEEAENDEPDELLGYTVVFQDREVGKVTDLFHNNAQFVLVVTTPAETEILIPLVDHFVSEIIPDPGVILLVNADSLLAESYT
ncbi:MAG: hypothetical protein PHD87_02540 [Candidatus Cloacimonetes bacterium]|nr:hypothetical protein [Candidatus Cloacimonadota bacterium]MDD4223446.1 hypothetical protein [Candidatus Cloacimonadota bacterium]